MVGFQGHRLKAVRSSRGLTQTELSERLGMNHRQIVRYETGVNDPSGDVIVRIARELEVSADYLLGLSDEPGTNLKAADLSPAEWRIIHALRAGLTVDAMQAFVIAARINEK